jgi:hypothetical protein
MTIEFTEHEKNAMLQVLNVAVKAGGLPVAGVAHKLAKKFTAPEGVNSLENDSLPEHTSPDKAVE